jgi:hypothetical protein
LRHRHADAPSSTAATLSTASRSVGWLKVAVATALPKTSLVHDTDAPGATSSVLDSRRTSRLSRGRSISRCGPRRTGSR